VRQIKIHEEWSPRGEYGHFNEDKDDWETGPLLEVIYFYLFVYFFNNISEKLLFFCSCN